MYTSAGHTSGDYDAWGTSLSGEYGKKILLENDWYVTPQAQLTLMRIGGENYDTNNGIRVRQDTLYSAVGRLGFELGRKLDEKGSVYAKASVLHDFAGNAETYLSHNGFTNSYSHRIQLQDRGQQLYLCRCRPDLRRRCGNAVAVEHRHALELLK